jgi:hypothetical protein
MATNLPESFSLFLFGFFFVLALGTGQNNKLVGQKKLTGLTRAVRLFAFPGMIR